jgi:putative transposase
LLEHCAHARFVWNLAVEQHSHWRPARTSAPGYLKQCKQLTEARAEYQWLAAGSQMVQQQPLRDFSKAMSAFFDAANPARRPTWRKAGRNEGFRIVALKSGEVRRLSRHTAEVRVPKVGWVRFRWSRSVSLGAKSYRVTRDRSGRWHIAFAVIPALVPGPGTGEVIGIDRGVAVSAALSSGELLRIPRLTSLFTSQRCSACGRVDRKSRESQADFRCTTCGFTCNADVNAAKNIAAGHAVTARGGVRAAGPVNREPQLLLQSA